MSLPMIPELCALYQSFCPAATLRSLRPTCTEATLERRTMAERLLDMTRVVTQTRAALAVMRGQWTGERDLRRAEADLQFALFVAAQNARADRVRMEEITAARVEAARVAAEPDPSEEEDDYFDEPSDTDSEGDLYHF
jgi:hypothetical protein